MELIRRRFFPESITWSSATARQILDSSPKGLMYGLDIMGSWLYDDENAFSQVKLLEIYDQLKDCSK